MKCFFMLGFDWFDFVLQFFVVIFRIFICFIRVFDKFFWVFRICYGEFRNFYIDLGNYCNFFSYLELDEDFFLRFMFFICGLVVLVDRRFQDRIIMFVQIDIVQFFEVQRLVQIIGQQYINWLKIFFNFGVFFNFLQRNFIYFFKRLFFVYFGVNLFLIFLEEF